MKRPYLTNFERLMIYVDTLIGSVKMLDLRWKQLVRSITRLFIVLTLVLMPISCSKTPEELIVGEWEPVGNTADEFWGEYHLIFTESGKMIFKAKNGTVTEDADGTYEVIAPDLILLGGDNHSTQYDIDILTNEIVVFSSRKSSSQMVLRKL